MVLKGRLRDVDVNFWILIRVIERFLLSFCLQIKSRGRAVAQLRPFLCYLETADVIGEAHPARRT